MGQAGGLQPSEQLCFNLDPDDSRSHSLGSSCNCWRFLCVRMSDTSSGQG